MEKIKNLENVVLPDGGVLMEVVSPKRLIVTPDGTEDQDSYGRIIAKHESVIDLAIGDIAIKLIGSLTGYKLKDKSYALCYRNNIVIAVHPDNFIDPDVLTGSVVV